MKLSDYRGKVVLLNFGCHETCALAGRCIPTKNRCRIASPASRSHCSGLTSSANPKSLSAGHECRGNNLAFLV